MMLYDYIWYFAIIIEPSIIKHSIIAAYTHFLLIWLLQSSEKANKFFDPAYSLLAMYLMQNHCHSREFDKLKLPFRCFDIDQISTGWKTSILTV